MSGIRDKGWLAVSVSIAVVTVGLALAADPGTAIKRTVLQTVEVPGSSYQVIESKVEIAANSHIPRHTHPGAVVGYLLEGDYSVQLEGQPRKTLARGETFLIPAGVVHEEFAGEHAATIIAVFTVEKGKPLSSPVK
jgi:quercetin dioxygenase-like cupin family protein